MSFLFGDTSRQPLSEPTAGGMDADRMPTNQQARPVPYLAGTRRIGVTWISQAFNVIVSESSRGGKKAGGMTSKDYTASAAALLCHGPLDAVTQIWLDGQIGWEGSLARGDDDYVEITIGARGVVRLYWGSDTQAIDPDLEELAAAEDPNAREKHPAYRGYAYIVLLDFFLGTSRTQFPQVELTVSRWPNPVIMGVSANLQGDCNPMCVLLDLLLNTRLGAGMAVTRLNTTVIADVAQALNDECIGISPYITQAASARQLLAELLEYCSGYLRADTQGRIDVGLVRPTCVTAPTWNEDDLTAEPQISPDEPVDRRTRAVVRFSNRQNSHKEDAIAYDSQGPALFAGMVPLTLERTWITRYKQAWATVVTQAIIAGTAGFTGKLKVKRGAAVGVRPGDQFRLSWAQWGVCNLPCRVETIVLPPPHQREVDVTFISDVGPLVSLLVPAPAYTPPPRLVRGPVPFEHSRVIEMPCALTPAPNSVGGAWRVVVNTGGGGGWEGEGDPPVYKRAVSFLCARPSPVVDGWSVHYRQALGNYTRVASSGVFALRGQIQDTISDSETDLLVKFLGLDILPPMDGDPAQLALIIGNEWLGIVEIGDLDGPATYPITVTRGNAGTTPTGYGTGEEIWLVDVSQLVVFTALRAGEEHTFKLTTQVMSSELSLADADPETVTLVLECPI